MEGQWWVGQDYACLWWMYSVQLHTLRQESMDRKFRDKMKGEWVVMDPSYPVFFLHHYFIQC